MIGLLSIERYEAMRQTYEAQQRGEALIDQATGARSLVLSVRLSNL